MRIFALLFCVCMAPLVWAEETAGPAAVVRPLEGDIPLPPEPPPPPEADTLGPAQEVSQLEPLSALPTEAELQAAAEAEAEAKRPPPLQPKAVAIQVQDMGQGRFLFMPQDAPLQHTGTLNASMFAEDAQPLLPVITPTVTAEADNDPTFEEDMATVRQEMEAIHEGLASLTARMTQPVEDATSPTIISPTEPISASTPPLPEAAKPTPPKPKPLPALTLSYEADNAHPSNPQALKSWAKKAAGRTVNLQIIATTAKPPLGTTIHDLAQTRWNHLRTLLKSQQITPRRTSFIYLTGTPTTQSLQIKVVP